MYLSAPNHPNITIDIPTRVRIMRPKKVLVPSGIITGSAEPIIITSLNRNWHDQFCLNCFRYMSLIDLFIRLSSLLQYGPKGATRIIGPRCLTWMGSLRGWRRVVIEFIAKLIGIYQWGCLYLAIRYISFRIISFNMNYKASDILKL